MHTSAQVHKHKNKCAKTNHVHKCKIKCIQAQEKMRTTYTSVHKRKIKCTQVPPRSPVVSLNLLKPILVSSPFVITTNMSTQLQLMFRSTMKPFYLSLLLELKTLPRPIISRWGLLVSKKRFDNEVRFEGLGKGEGEEDLKRS